MQRTITSTAAGLLLLLGALGTAQAATPIAGDYLSFSGFGTLGGVRTNTDEGQYGKDLQVGGATRHVAADVDSNLGLQLNAKATSWLTGTLQVLTAKRNENTVDPRVEWAYLAVAPLDGLQVRAGRMAIPTFLISDSRNIGFANTWVRAPNEVYALNAFGTFDGGDVNYRRAFGPVTINLTALAGKTKFKPGGFDGEGRKLRGVNATVETEWATFRAGRVKTEVAIPAAGVEGDPYGFNGYGISIDRGDVVAQAEFVQRRTGQQPQGTDADGWYVMGGYRFGKVLPYAFVARTAPKYAGSMYYASATQKTVALGARWDVLSNADLKFQVDRVDTSGTKGISFTTPVSFGGFGPPIAAPVRGNVTVLSATLDFTF